MSHLLAFVAPPLDAMNMCLTLITQGHEDTAFYILKSFPMLQSDHQTKDSGSFFLRHCVSMNMVQYNNPQTRRPSLF